MAYGLSSSDVSATLHAASSRKFPVYSVQSCHVVTFTCNSSKWHTGAKSAYMIACDYVPVTMTFKLDLDRVKVKQLAKYSSHSG